MRRTMMIVLAGVLSAATASAGAAQQGGQRGDRAQPGQPMARLFEGIELTANQQERVAEILAEHREEAGRPAMGRGRDRGDSAEARLPRRPQPDSAGVRPRTDRPRPDSAAIAELRAERGERMAEMREERLEVIAELRAVLRDDQLQTFDANAAALEKAFENGPRRGRGGRTGGAPDRS
jgi:Spy/CpxP family protein refolding chaperone